MRPVIRKILLVFWLGLFGLFGFLYNAQYFRWRSCFNEVGRCFDAGSGVVYHAQSGAVWLSLTVLALVAAVFQIWRLLKSN